MKIVIAGGNGFLGKALELYWTNKNHEVKILTRSPQKANDVYWDAKTLGKWSEELNDCDVLVNLVGKSVDCRYTEENKKEILRSRIDSTSVLQAAINVNQHKPKIWMNASSATIYIHAETQNMDETSGIIGDDFSMNICKQWEKIFFEKAIPHCRKVSLRTSIVLGEGGGAWPKLKMISKLGLGGIQGRGNQFVSYIHIDDFCRAVDFIIEQEKLDGPVNVTSPSPITNKAFMEEVRKNTKALFGLPSPTFLLEFASIFLRTETELLLKSRKVVPKKLLDNGFKFEKSIANL